MCLAYHAKATLVAMHMEDICVYFPHMPSLAYIFPCMHQSQIGRRKKLFVRTSICMVGRLELISMHGMEGGIWVSRVHLIGYLLGRNLYITPLLSLPLSLLTQRLVSTLNNYIRSTSHSHRPPALPRALSIVHGPLPRYSMGRP